MYSEPYYKYIQIEMQGKKVCDMFKLSNAVAKVVQAKVTENTD